MTAGGKSAKELAAIRKAENQRKMAERMMMYRVAGRNMERERERRIRDNERRRQSREAA